MERYNEMLFLPSDLQVNWQARLEKATPTEAGVFRLVAARRATAGFEQQRITVLVIDENGLPLPNVRVAFSYSTAKIFVIEERFQWSPPSPRRADLFWTEGSGQTDQVQGSPVKKGEPGGVTVYILEPEFSSDIVSGCGMLANHDGMHLTFQLQRVGVKPLLDWLEDIEQRLEALEAAA